MIVSDVVILVSIPNFDLTVGIILTILVADHLVHIGHLLQMLPPGPAYPAIVHFAISNSIVELSMNRTLVPASSA